MEFQVNTNWLQSALRDAIRSGKVVDFPKCCPGAAVTHAFTRDNRYIAAYCHGCKKLIKAKTTHRRRITRPCQMCAEPHGIDEHDFGWHFLCKCGYIIEFRQEGEHIVLHIVPAGPTCHTPMPCL